MEEEDEIIHGGWATRKFCIIISIDISIPRIIKNVVFRHCCLRLIEKFFFLEIYYIEKKQRAFLQRYGHRRASTSSGLLRRG